MGTPIVVDNKSERRLHQWNPNPEDEIHDV
jgi:hypothetical protein